MLFLLFIVPCYSIENLKPNIQNNHEIRLDIIEYDLTYFKNEVKDLKTEIKKSPNPWISILISGISTVIALIAFFWTIFLYYKNNKVKLKVDVNFSVKIYSKSRSIQILPMLVLSYKITNLSKTERYINRPFIKLPFKIENAGEFSDSINIINPSEKEVFPFLLQSNGSQYKSEYYLNEKMANIIEGQNLSKKIRIGVTDTFNKTFYSKKIQLALIKSHIDANIMHECD